jgi:competence protein ComEC
MAGFQNIPAFKFSLLLIAGILIGSEYSFRSDILVIILFVILISIYIICRSELNPIFNFVLISFAIVLFGIFKSNLDFFMTGENSIKEISPTGKKSITELIGIIKELPDYDSNRVRFILSSEIIISQKDSAEVNGDVIVTLRKDIFSKINTQPPLLQAGDRVALTGKLSDAPSQRNPGEFDYKKYLTIQNIFKTFFVTGYKNIYIISNNNLGYFTRNILYPAKIFALKNIDNNLYGDEAAFLKGLVTGERSDITSEMKDDFVKAGVMHLIAVSGLNVAYIIISVTLFLSLFRIPPAARSIITIAFLIFYCLLTGSPASIVRATIMGVLVLTAFLIERRINFYNAIGIAAMIILIYDSKQLFDPGFILSFSATLSMVIIYSKFEKPVVKKISEWNSKGKKFTLWISVLFFTTLSAQLGTLPLTALYFGKISIISVVANLIAVPLANLSLAIGFFQIVTASVSEYLSSVISETNNLLLIFQLEFIKWCASLDFSYIQSAGFNFSDLICYYLILTILLTAKFKREILFRIILCFLIFAGSKTYGLEFTRKLRVTFLDIGQGDCALIQTADDQNILVDCGTMTFTYNSGERTIAPYLRRNGISKIDLLIITHLHSDHIGGINYLLQNFKIGKILESGQRIRTQFTKTMDSLIACNGITREKIRSGDLINDLNNLRLYFLFPTNDFVDAAGNTIGNNLNNGSVTFILKYKDTRFFFGGDIEKEAEKFLNDTYSDFLRTDILKVAHHGSNTSTTILFIIKNKPEYAIISCGMFNKFNHPSDIVLNRLENMGVKTYRTDLDGAVIIDSDGYSTEVVDWK